MSIFPKWLIVDFRQKFEILLSLIFFEKDLHMILNNVLNGLQKCHFKIVSNGPFFLRG